MIQCVLIRHGKTQGNLEYRYVGTTDEPILSAERERLATLTVPTVSHVFTSPLLRCRQSASILYPDTDMTVTDDLRECDFGRFEYHNATELDGDQEWQSWIDSGGRLTFPLGEQPDAFRRRCAIAFAENIGWCREHAVTSAAWIVHGGTIMSIMEQYALPHQGYYTYRVDNADGYILELDGDETHDQMELSGRYRRLFA